MAIVVSPFFHRITGSVGNQTFTTVKNKIIAKAKIQPPMPPTVPTNPQAAQRAMFKFLMYYAKRQNAIIRTGFPPFQQNTPGKSQINEYMKFNLNNGCVIPNLTAPYDPTYDPSLNIWSKGNLLTMEGGFVSDPNISTFTVNFTDNSNPQNFQAKGAAIPVIIIQESGNLTGQAFYFFIDFGNSRSSGLTTKSLPLGLSGLLVNVWGYFMSSEFYQIPANNSYIPKEVSDTAYLGTTTLI